MDFLEEDVLGRALVYFINESAKFIWHHIAGNGEMRKVNISSPFRHCDIIRIVVMIMIIMTMFKHYISAPLVAAHCSVVQQYKIQLSVIHKLSPKPFTLRRRQTLPILHRSRQPHPLPVHHSVWLKDVGLSNGVFLGLWKIFAKNKLVTPMFAGSFASEQPY